VCAVNQSIRQLGALIAIYSKQVKATDFKFETHVSRVSPDMIGGTVAAVPPPFRPSDPALRGSCPLVTPY